VTRRSLQLQCAKHRHHATFGRKRAARRLWISRAHRRRLLRVRANIPSLEAQRMNALYRLAALTGKPPAEYPRSVESCATAPRLQQAAPDRRCDSVAAAAAGRARSGARAGAATARIGVATADLYPRIAVGASAGSNRRDERFPAHADEPLRHRAGHPLGGESISGTRAHCPGQCRRQVRPGPVRCRGAHGASGC